MRYHVYLRFLPLCSTGLADLKVDPLNALGAAHDLDPAQVGLEVVEDALRQLQEGLQPGVVRHVLRQVGQQNRHIEANVLLNHNSVWSDFFFVFWIKQVSSFSMFPTLSSAPLNFHTWG